MSNAKGTSTCTGTLTGTGSLSGTARRPGKKPTVKLVGQDGNAMMILGLCLRAAKKAGWTEEQIKEFSKEAKSGDYDKLLQTCMKYFEVK